MAVRYQSEAEQPSLPQLAYDRMAELRAFDETKAGVKGIVDSKVTKIPRFFIHDKLKLNRNSETRSSRGGDSIPAISLKGIDRDPNGRKEVVGKIRAACEKWGFFQLTDHGIPSTMLTDILEGIRRFHEQDTNLKKNFYKRKAKGAKVLCFSNFDLFSSPAANWRDTLLCEVAPQLPEPEELPEVCKSIILDYSIKVQELAATLLELLSEALGLNSSYLKNIGCAEAFRLLGQYYPPCPEPELTLGATTHSDNSVITILLQDHIGGLQVQLRSQWFDVDPVPGALVVNLGELMQLITNDRFISANHRVLAKSVGPRISVASFINLQHDPENSRRFGPLKELMSEGNPPLYREINLKEFADHFYTKGLDGIKAIEHFKF